MEPKTKQSRRTIAIPKLTLSALAEHKGRQSQERLLAGSAWRVPVLICEGKQVAVDDLVFITRFGNPFDAPTVTHRFQALLLQAGIGHHRFHDLRHTAATLLAVQGVHPRANRAALGWENLSMLNFDAGGCQRGCQGLQRRVELRVKLQGRLVGPEGLEPSTNGL